MSSTPGHCTHHGDASRPRAPRILGMLAAFALGLPAESVAQEGALDPTFGTGGLVVADFGTDALLGDLVVQSDGRLVVVGTHPTGLSPGFFVARFLPKGALDPSFGSGGIVRYPADVFGSGRTVTLQADDKIVVGGWVSSAPFPGAENPAVVRLLRDGTPDPSFGNGGLAVASFGSLGSGVVVDVAMQPSGRLVALTAWSNPKAPSGPDYLMGFRSNGAVDASFGSGGFKVLGLNGPFGVPSTRGNGLHLQPDGRPFVAGFYGDATGVFGRVARYRADGARDCTFGDGLFGPCSGVSQAWATGGARFTGAGAVLPDGRLLLLATSPGASYLAARYRRDGSLDPDYGAGGLVVGGPSGTADLFLLSDGSHVNAGSQGLGLTRFLADGTLDTSFGTGGQASAPTAASSTVVALQSPGGLIAGGEFGGDVVLARYLVGSR